MAFSQLLSARGIASVGIDSLSYGRHGDFMVVDMDMDLKPVDVQSSRAQVITPMIVSERGDSICQLPSVGVYGRQRYINYLRRGRKPLSRPDEAVFERSDSPASYDYLSSVPFRPWMESSMLVIRRGLYGCVNCLIDERFDTVAYNVTLTMPEDMFTDIGTEVDDTIEFTLEGSAFIDFVVDQTKIKRDYRNNDRELLKIEATIDTVRNDPDVTITRVWLKGFASPESPYSHNRDLAEGRTEELKDHIRQLYDFDPAIIVTDYEPEDWAGLRKAVESSNIDNKAGILEIIDSDMDPDPKEELLKKRYPKEYGFMRDNFYPALRHTDYMISYMVKKFDDPEKIREVMRTKPNRLTRREFHILAKACVPESDEYYEVFETAARMYPDDPDANINAAAAAIKRKDYVSAEMYLSRAGDSEEAVYARGALAFMNGDYAKAEEILNEIADDPKAARLLRDIEAKRPREAQNSVKIMLK